MKKKKKKKVNRQRGTTTNAKIKQPQKQNRWMYRGIKKV
jgi:hypothetical protein